MIDVSVAVHGREIDIVGGARESYSIQHIGSPPLNDAFISVQANWIYPD